MKIPVILLCLASVLPAQEKARTCRILFPGGPEQVAEKYYLFDGNQSREVSLPRLSFSPVYELLPGDIKIHLLTAPVGKVEEVPKGAPAVTVPADVRDIYLLVTHDSENAALPLRMRVVNANYDKIRHGEMLWFNLTQKHLAGKIGASPLNLAANTTELVKAPASSAGDYPVEIYFRVPGDERSHPLMETQWFHDPRSRSIVLVFDEGRRRAPRVMSFPDFRLVEKQDDE